MNGVILSAVIIGVYIVSLLEFCDGKWKQSDILDLDDYEKKLAQARTVAFISLVYSENVRAYLARSFDRPFWVNIFGNRHMQMAIVLAQLALYIAVLVPGVSDKILGLRGLDIGAWGWLVALAGPIATVILCELAKVITYFQVQRYQESLKQKRLAEEAKLVAMNPSLPALLSKRDDAAAEREKAGAAVDI